MKKNLFLKLSMLLFVLGLSVNGAWGGTPETDNYWAKLTAQPSTGTGGTGKVFVSNVSNAEKDYQNVSSAYSSKDSYVQIDGNVVNFSVYAKADDGSYFVGWSDFNGGTERAHTQSYDCGYEPSAKRGISNALEYTIYATFEPIRIGGYTITGSNTSTGDKVQQRVVFEFQQSVALKDFDQTGGTNKSRFVLTATDGTENVWKKPSTGSFEFGTGNTSAILKVNFTPRSEDPIGTEYTATVTLTTMAGISVTVPLYGRKEDASPVGGNAVLFDGKTQTASGTVAEMLAVNTSAYTNPILKLSGDYNDAVVLNKNITLDLNGYTLSNTLTVSAGEVTLAYSPFGGTLSNNVSVTGGKLTLAGGTITGNVNVSAGATLEQNGAAITGTVTNAGTMTTTDGSITGQLASSGTLTLNGGTFTNESGVAVSITGGAADIKRGTISGSTYGVQTTGGSATIGKLAAISGTAKALNGAGGTLTVNNGKFAQAAKFAEGTIVFNSAYFKDDASAVAAAYSKQLWRNTAGVEFRDGYEFFVGDQAAAQASNVSVCRIGQTAYPSLEEALAYANNNPSKSVTIFMENDYTLPAGYYTIPANATLVVPMLDDQNIAYPYITHRSEESAYPTPYVFRTLTFANGVNMSVLGTIELSGEQFSKGGDPEQSIPGGPYGRLILKPGSHVTLNDGGELRAWGYVTGDGTRDANGTYLSGEIDARRGSIVREQFQIGDWKGGDISFTMIQDKDPQQKTHLFPIYEYFIQNVESPVKYHPGSALYCSTAVDAQVLAYANDIKVVGVSGEPAMFLMDQMADADNTWVRKWYDANKDQQVYEVNSGAQLGSILIDLGEVPKTLIDPGQPGNYAITMDSRKYVLPLTSNMKIHLLSGNMQFTQSTACLPGMEVEIDKESTISLIKPGHDGVVEGALYFYDSEQWGRYVRNNKYGTVVHYSATLNAKPTARDVSSAAAIGDAILNVHGTFQVGANCAVYTTVGKTKNTVGGDDVYTQDLTKGGASIISTNADAGTFIFDAPAPNATGVTISGGDFVYNAQGELNPEVLVNYDNSSDGLIINPTARGNSAHIYGFELCTSALLKNGAGAEHAFAETGGTPAGKSYCYINNQWSLMEVDSNQSCFMKDNYDVFYAKPADYVAIVGTKITPNPSTPDYKVIVGNEDHTYSDKAGAGRLFILTDGCQWWEVEKKDNLYHCIHPNNDTYYYWEPDVDEETDFDYGEWKEKRFTITWKNWDGTEIKSYDYKNLDDGNPREISYSVTYGTMAEFLGTNPTRESNIDYIYDFTGWQPALGKVTSDVTYTATYTQKPRKYTIIFQNEGGTEIERQFLTHNEIPACENVPTRTGFTLQWEPAISAVTGDATYRATWLEEPPTEYAITFFDYDGTTKLKPTDETPYMVAVGAMPIAPANPANKPATNEFTYVFDHWSPALEEVSATSIKSYTAVYAEVAKTYTIKFVKENGDPDTPADVIESHQYQYGETPVCANTPSKPATAQYTYKLRWDPQIQTVMGAATYRAVFDETLNKYTVSVMSNPSGACAISGVGIYEYNTAADAVTITITPNAGYTFTGWSDGQGGTNTTRQMAVTADINLVANFTVAEPDYTITWKNEAGTANLVDPVGQKANTATIYTGEIPTKDASAQYVYTFDGWTTEANGAGTFYKNNMTPKATANATYYAHFAASQVVLEVGLGQAQDIAEATTVNQLILNSNGTVSGQLTGANLLNVTGDCFYDLTGTFTAGKWYAVAVPWQVTAGDIRANGTPLTWHSGNYLAYYDGSVRAAQGKVDACWKYLTNGSTLEPGRLYMLYLENNASVLRFPKKAGAPILTSSTNISAYAAAEATDANWNGIANPAIFYAYLGNTGATVGQVFNADAQSYEAVALSNKLIVAKPIFVQATNTGSAMAVTTPPTSAPIRRNANVETQKAECQVTITSRGRMQDRLFIHADENKEADTYTVGQDVLKFGVSSSVAQMWVNRYDAKLCMNTMAPVNNVAEYPLSIYAPKDGDYTIAIEKEQVTDDYALYLTYNGEAIWNLSDGAYTANLEKGTDANYGLRITFKAPEVATGIDEAIVDSKDATAAKVLINGHVFIIREGAVYTINGQLVK